MIRVGGICFSKGFWEEFRGFIVGWFRLNFLLGRNNFQVNK